MRRFQIPPDLRPHLVKATTLNLSAQALLLQSLGFRQLRLKHSRNVWRNKELRLIFKQPFFLASAPPKGWGIPTIDLDHGYVVQPLAEMDDRKGALDALKARLPDLLPEERGIDLHYWNVGHHQGKAVMFDW